MVQPIVQTEHPALRAVAETVLLNEMTGSEIQAVIRDMKDTLAHCPDGLAIAAPQIGKSLRIFVVSGKFFNAASTDSAQHENEKPGPDMVFINPEITKKSRSKALLEEGCLSVRWKYGETPRHDKVTVSAFDEHGIRFIRGASGLLAQVFQHEIDHLNGTLFIDTAKNIRDVPPENHEHHEH